MASEELKDINSLMETLKGYDKTPLEADVCLNTLTTVLSNNGVAQEHFQKSGGLSLVFSIMKNSDDKLRQTCLLTLATAVDGNKKSQQFITAKNIYALVKAFLKPQKVDLSTTAMYLLLCLSSENSQGQEFARETKCIHTLCDFFKQSIPPMNVDCDLGEQWFDSLDEVSLHQWVVASNTLHVLQTNPQNVENQRVCSQLIVPFTSILRSKTKQNKVVESIVMFMRACVTGNGEMQSKLSLTGGLRALNDLLEDCVSTVEDQFSARELSLVNQLVNTLGCAITGHVANQEAAVDLNIVPNLLKCLQLAVYNSNETALETLRTKSLFALLGCVDHCDGNQELCVNNGGVSLLIDLIVKSQAEDQKHLAILVLHCCVVTKGIHIEYQTHDMATERMTAAASSPKTKQTKATQTCMNQGISVGNQMDSSVIETHSKSTQVMYTDTIITHKNSCQNTSTQTSLTCDLQQIADGSCYPSTKSTNEILKYVGETRMKVVPEPFVCEQTPWHSNQQAGRLKRQAKVQLPSKPVKMFYSAHTAPASDDEEEDEGGDDDDDDSVDSQRFQCAACGPNVNSRNLLDILLNGHVCEQHKKLGKLLVKRKPQKRMVDLEWL